MSCLKRDVAMTSAKGATGIDVNAASDMLPRAEGVRPFGYDTDVMPVPGVRPGGSDTTMQPLATACSG